MNAACVYDLKVKSEDGFGKAVPKVVASDELLLLFGSRAFRLFGLFGFLNCRWFWILWMLGCTAFLALGFSAERQLKNEEKRMWDFQECISDPPRPWSDRIHF